MTAKRFTYDSKTISILKDGKFWLDGNVDTACNHSEICNELNKLVEENEQLKAQLKDYHNAFDCSQCRYQNYDWFDDGDEFEVCDKGNNEAQMEYHSCKDWEEL